MSRAEEMRELFARYERSGQSLLAFGKAEGIPYSRLLYWRRKFEAEPSARRTAPRPELVPVRLVDPPQPATTDKFEVFLPNGIALDVPPTFDPASLERLVRVLASC